MNGRSIIGIAMLAMAVVGCGPEPGQVVAEDKATAEKLPPSVVTWASVT